MGIDPGRKKPMSACTIGGENIPIDWNKKERKQVIDNAMDTNEWITNKDYYDLCGMTDSTNFEEKRRKKNLDYMQSIKNLSQYNSKNIFDDQYIKEKLKSWNINRKELFTKYRLKRKFKQYSLTQSGLAKCCDNITKNFNKKCKKENKSPIILIGNGTFSPGGSGYASSNKVPRVYNK